MDKLSKNLKEIVNQYIEKRVSQETRSEFVTEAINFNINVNACSKYDLMRIKRKISILSKNEENKNLTKASIYSYILYNLLNTDEIPEADKRYIKIALVGIRETITDYLTYKIDEETLNNNLYEELTYLGV